MNTLRINTSLQIKTDFERRILEQFKERVKDLDQIELTIIRFLIAREFDMDRAEDMLRKNLIWRKENGMDNILDKWDAPHFLKEDLPYRITGFDYTGGPILWVPMGRWNSRPWIEEGYGDDCLKWAIRFMEDALVTAHKSKQGPFQGTLIFDIANLNYYNASYLPSLKVLYNGFKAMEQNYPETVRCVYVINAPWIFNVPYKFIKHIISPRTLSKVKFIEGDKKDWLPILTEMAPRDSLPQEYFNDKKINYNPIQKN